MMFHERRASPVVHSTDALLSSASPFSQSLPRWSIFQLLGYLRVTEVRFRNSEISLSPQVTPQLGALHDKIIQGSRA